MTALKDRGFLLVGLDSEAEAEIGNLKLTAPLGIVLGAEGRAAPIDTLDLRSGGAARPARPDQEPECLECRRARLAGRAPAARHRRLRPCDGKQPGTPASHKKAETLLLRYALNFPEAREEFPWDERVIKVRGKIFVFLGIVEGTLRVGVKLPVSAEMALTLPFTEPTGYGLGRAGWITARFAARDNPPLDLLRGWIEQSYRAVAPKRLAASLDAAKMPAPAKTRRR